MGHPIVVSSFTIISNSQVRIVTVFHSVLELCQCNNEDIPRQLCISRTAKQTQSAWDQHYQFCSGAPFQPKLRGGKISLGGAKHQKIVKKRKKHAKISQMSPIKVKFQILGGGKCTPCPPSIGATGWPKWQSLGQKFDKIVLSHMKYGFSRLFGHRSHLWGPIFIFAPFVLV